MNGLSREYYVIFLSNKKLFVLKINSSIKKSQNEAIDSNGVAGLAGGDMDLNNQGVQLLAFKIAAVDGAGVPIKTSDAVNAILEASMDYPALDETLVNLMGSIKLVECLTVKRIFLVVFCTKINPIQLTLLRRLHIV